MNTVFSILVHKIMKTPFILSLLLLVVAGQQCFLVSKTDPKLTEEISRGLPISGDNILRVTNTTNKTRVYIGPKFICSGSGCQMMNGKKDKSVGMWSKDKSMKS